MSTVTPIDVPIDLFARLSRPMILVSSPEVDVREVVRVPHASGESMLAFTAKGRPSRADQVLPRHVALYRSRQRSGISDTVSEGVAREECPGQRSKSCILGKLVITWHLYGIHHYIQQ